MTEKSHSQIDPTIVPATVCSTKPVVSASSSPITVDDQDWTQEAKVDPKKILCTPEANGTGYDSCYQTQAGGYTTNDKTDTPNNRHSRVLKSIETFSARISSLRPYRAFGYPPVPIPNTEVKPARA